MSNRHHIKNGVVIEGITSGSTLLDIQGTQGQLFAITDDLTGDIFSVSDISGIPILNVNSSGLVYTDGNTNLGSGSLYVDSVNGRVGIETVSPSYALDVNGDINIASGNFLRVFGKPGISWDSGNSRIRVGDTNTTNLALLAGSTTPRMFISSSGNVGIGTATPYTPLFVNVGTNQNLAVRSNTVTELYAVSDNNGVYQALKINGGSIYIDNGGKVGVGTVNPEEKLHVYGGNLKIGLSTNPSGYFGYISASWGGGSTYPTLYSADATRWIMHINPHISYVQSGSNGYSSTSMTGATLRYASNTTATSYWDAGVGSNGVGTDKYTIGRQGTSHIVIDNTGKVGIGTATPSEKLEVVDTTSTNTYLKLNASAPGRESGIKLRQSTTYGFDIYYDDALGANKGLNIDAVVNNVNYPAIFSTVSTNPYVGIGTTNPTSKLTVNGNTEVTGSLTTTEAIQISSGSIIYFIANKVANEANMLGYHAGTDATAASWGNFIGRDAGSYATYAMYSNFLGYLTGYSATLADHSNFLGREAGRGATDADRSNFLGKETGFGATNAYRSNFLGIEAGKNASYAFHSNFLGDSAGQNAINASYSTLIGFHAGYTPATGSSIGSNNIIIGTNVTLPVGSTNSLNIGGVLFGTGLNSDIVSDLLTGPVPGGRIGVGKNDPSTTLDVNGDTTVTGSFNLTGTLNAGGNISLGGSILSIYTPDGNHQLDIFGENTSDMYIQANENTLHIDSTSGTILTGGLTVDGVVTGTLTSNTSTTVNGTLSVNSDSIFTTGAGGNVGIGTITPGAKLEVYASQSNFIHSLVNSNEAGFALKTYNSGSVTGNGVVFKQGLYYGTVENSSVNFHRGAGGTDGFLSFTTSKIERLRIDPSGNVGIGTTTPGNPLHILQNGTGFLVPFRAQNAGDPGTGATRMIVGNTVSEFFLQAYGSTSPGNLSSAASIWANAGSRLLLGAGSGKPVMIASNNNYTAPQITVAGNGNFVGINNSAPATPLHLSQSAETNTSGIRIGYSTVYWDIYGTTGTPPGLYFKYNGGANGGYLVNTADVGQIDFTGQHRSTSETISGSIENYVGLLVSSTGVYRNLNSGSTPTVNEALPVVSLSTTANDKKIFGVISDKEDIVDGSRSYSSGAWVSLYESTETEGRLIINSLGEGGIWVTNINGTFENGDYITSSEIPGYGMKQNDDLLHNYTVAKITQDCDFTNGIDIEHNGLVYKKQFVGCTYHCG